MATPAPSPADALLAAFLDPCLTLADIAAAAGLTLSQLAAWFNLRETQAVLAELREMSRFRSQILADLKLPAAVDTLARINDDLAALQPEPDAPITVHLRLADTARRTATAIQRLATPRPPRISQTAARSVGNLADGHPDRLDADQDAADHLPPPIEPGHAPAASPAGRARDHPHTPLPTPAAAA